MVRNSKGLPPVTNRTPNERLVYRAAKSGNLDPLLARLRSVRLDAVLPEPTQNVTEQPDEPSNDLWAAVESEWFEGTLTDAQYERCKAALYRR